MSRYAIRAKYDGGPLRRPVTLLVVHSAETPLRYGYARSIGKYFTRPDAKTSAHVMVDPRDVVQMVPKNRIAYHCGYANKCSLGYEQAGYARLSRRQWTTGDGLAQIKLLALEIRKDADIHHVPLRWATDAQIRAAYRNGVPGGLCTHGDVARVVGGSTHTDPMPNYPKDLLLELVRRGTDPVKTNPFLEDDMLAILLDGKNNYVSDFKTKRRIETIEEDVSLRATGIPVFKVLARVTANIPNQEK